MAILLAPVLAAGWNTWSHTTATGDPVLVLFGRSYGRELMNRLREMGHYVILIDQSVRKLNWRFAHEAHFLDVFDLANTQRIADLARRMGATVAMFQSDDKLLPQVAAVNAMLGAGVAFPQRAVAASLSKRAMHAALERAGMRTVPNAVLDPAAGLGAQPVPYPLIVKADQGQGAHGYRLCQDLDELEAGAASVRAAFPESAVIAEHYLTGKQFDIEGIVHRGEMRPYIVVEENFFRYPPNFMRCWYLFNPALSGATEAEMMGVARAALKACDIQSGAFHVEVRFDGEGHAYAIDLSNRMGADFPRSVPDTTARDMIGDYVQSMLGREVAPPPPAKRGLELRYYTHPFEPGAGRVRREAASRPQLARVEQSPDGTEMFVFASDDEGELRALIGTLDDILQSA